MYQVECISNPGQKRARFRVKMEALESRRCPKGTKWVFYPVTRGDGMSVRASSALIRGELSIRTRTFVLRAILVG